MVQVIVSAVFALIMIFNAGETLSGISIKILKLQFVTGGKMALITKHRDSVQRAYRLQMKEDYIFFVKIIRQRKLKGPCISLENVVHKCYCRFSASAAII